MPIAITFDYLEALGLSSIVKRLEQAQSELLTTLEKATIAKAAQVAMVIRCDRKGRLIYVI